MGEVSEGWEVSDADAVLLPFKLRDVPELRAFLERMYGDEVRHGGAELVGLPVSTQALLLGLAMGMEVRIEKLESEQ